MIEDEVKQTRCTTCDADHEYKRGMVPAARRKKLDGGAAGDAPEAALRVRPDAESHPDDDVNPAEEVAAEPATETATSEIPESAAPAENADIADPEAADVAAGGEDDG